jgi:hypothetical protein
VASGSLKGRDYRFVGKRIGGNFDTKSGCLHLVEPDFWYGMCELLSEIETICFLQNVSLGLELYFYMQLSLDFAPQIATRISPRTDSLLSFKKEKIDQEI